MRRAFIAAVLLAASLPSAHAERSGFWPFQYPGADVVEADPRGDSPVLPALRAAARRLGRSCDPKATETAMWVLTPSLAGFEGTVRAAEQAGYAKRTEPARNGARITLLSRPNERLLLAAQVRVFPSPAVQARGLSPEKALLVSVCRLR